MELKPETLPWFPEVFMAYLEMSLTAMRNSPSDSREYVLHHFAASLLIKILKDSRSFSGTTLSMLQQKRVQLEESFRDLDPVLMRELRDTVPFFA